MALPLSDTVLIISSELGINSSLLALKKQCPLAQTRFIYLLEDLRGKADATLKARTDVFIVQDFAQHREVEIAFDCIEERYAVTRAVPSDEFALFIAAWANDRWQLPGIDYATALKFRDKKQMKAIAERAGIPTAREITPDDIRHHRVPFPIIMKPRSLAGSVGARIIHEAHELPAALTSDGQVAYRDMDEQQCFLETYNPNPLYHLDAIVIKGALSFLSVGEYSGKPLQFLQEQPLGSRRVAEQEVTQLWRPFCTAVVTAFDAPDGVYHIEAFKDQRDHVELLEIAYRPGGGPIAALLHKAHGVDLYLMHIGLQLGAAPLPTPRASPLGYGWLMFPKRHLSTQRLLVKQITMPPLDALATLISHTVLAPGDVASGEFYCHSECLGTFIFLGDYQRVVQDQRRVYDTFKATFCAPK